MTEITKRMRKNSNRRVIGTLAVITLCLTVVIMPAMTQSAISLFDNAGNATNGESNDAPMTSPSPAPTSMPTPVQTQTSASVKIRSSNVILPTSYGHDAFYENNIFCESFIVYESTTRFRNSTENVIEEQINAEIPDLTVSNITCDGPPKAELENIGSAPARNVTVRFSRDVYKGAEDYPPYEVENDGFYSISHKDAKAKVMRVHFEYLYVDEKKNGSLRIGNGTSGVDYKKDRPKGFWSSWIEADSFTPSISLILNKGRYKVDRYEYGWDEPDDPIEIPDGGKREEEVPFTAENEIYNLTVFVDPENRVEESNEANNEEKKKMGPDLTFVFPEITFLNKNRNAVASDKLIARENHTIRVNIKNAGCVAATDFSVKLYVNKSYNATSDELIAGFPMSEQITRLEPGVRSEVDFSWTPEDGFYRVKVTVDENKEVPEINDINNVFLCSDEVKAGEPGYKAKDEPLRIGGKGTLNGGIIYDPYCKYVCPDPNTVKSYDYSHVFDINLPQNADIELARLYMYVWGDKADPKHPGFRMGWLPEMELKFSEKAIQNPTIYADTTGASAQNYTYATYCYDVTNPARDKKNWRAEAHFTRNEPMRFGVNGMALLVVYQEGNSVLTSYWIGEGSDVLMAKNMKFPTGFEFEECTRKCMFEGMADAQKANASLLTVLTPYTSYGASKLLPEAGGKGDSLSFQGLGMQKVGTLIGDTTGHWKSRHSITIAFTENEWEYVDVKEGTNIAEVQSRGNYLVLKHAILKVEYPPDLVPCIPKSVVVGNPITVNIENQGKSKAKDFNVSFSVNGDPEEKMHVEELEGESRVQLTLPWTPHAVGQLVRLNISVDCDNEVRELNENNNIVSQLVAVADRVIIPIFDTGSSDNSYPSISGIHKGTIRLNHTSTVNKMYTYACPGTGGHTEYIEISNESGIVAIGQWEGYTGDGHNISFYPSFRMLANHTYNYTIRTGSYPQIHHTGELKAKGGMGIINCTSFVDANGRSYNNRIPAIRMEGNFVNDNLPDLEINEIEAYYTNTDIRYLNLKNDVKVKITNNGSINTGPFEIKLVANTEDVDIKTIPVLEPNSSTYVVFNWTPIYNVTRPPISAYQVSENYTLNAIVDPENRIIESNETNNMMTVNVSAIWNGRMGGNGVLGEPYITTQHHGKLHGSTIYTFGDSYKYWKYAVQPGNHYTIKYDVTLPPGARVELANLYTYFEWFVTEQPKADVTFATPDGENHLSIEGWYWDKAYAFIFGPFLWGVLKYDVTLYINKSGTYNFSLKHGGGPKYFVDGALLFIVYRDESEPLIEYWVSEGADLIGGRDIEYLRYDDTTAKAEFTGGEIDIANVTNVTLFSVVNWGFQTDLWFNGHLLGTDCFTSINPYQGEIAQYNVAKIPVEYLNSTYNLVEMKFRGNCRNMPANAFLVVEYKNDER